MDAGVRTNPFPGLRPFGPEEADLFFGRDKQSDELVRRLAGRRFLAVVGTSGSGKSSLVRAGLLPSLESGFMAEAGAHWRIAIVRPQDDPIGFLARALVECGALAKLNLAQSAAEGVVETTLRRSGLGLVEVARLARFEPHENLLIVVDQFEELFRFADVAIQRGAGDEAPAFVKLLLEAARQTEVPVYVVITMRSDFLGDCARFRDLPETISDCQYLIPRLTRDELQAVITGPVGVRGGRIAPSLVQRLLNDVGDNMDQLPVLQHALMRAWDHWERSDPTERPIELSDLEAIGGMAEALSRHADEAFASLASEQDREVAERLFKCLTERGADNRETRRPTQLSRIAAIANAGSDAVVRVIEVFRAPGRSFLMPPQGVSLSGDSVIDISHESLIRQWRELRMWVEEEAESRATYLRVVEAARLHRAGKAGLWGEPDLTCARQWQQREVPNATWAERYSSGYDEASAFLRDSEAAHTAELERERERARNERLAKERELEQAKTLAAAQRQRADEQAAASIRQRRTNRFLLLCAVVAFATASFGWIQKLEAEKKGKLALSRQFTMLAAKDHHGGDLQRALLFAAAGHSMTPDKEARAELQRALSAQQPTHTFLTRQQGKVWSVAFSPDGKTLASASADKTVTLWDVATRKSSREPFRGHQDEVSSVAFSPDGKTLASASDDKTVILWDVATGKSLREPFRGHQDGVSSVAFSTDGKTLASGSSDKTVILWDVDTGKRLRVLEAHKKEVSIVAFSPDGKTLASASFDKTVIVWEVESGKHGTPLAGHEDRIWDIAFSPDGKTLASASFDKTVRLWNVEEGKLDKTLADHRDPVRSVAFSPDGEMLASSSSDRTVILWDVASGERVREPLKAHKDDVWDIAFSRDGQLASASLDGTVILWDMKKLNLLGEPLEGQQGKLYGVALSPDGKTLASAGGDGTVILWDVASRTKLGEPLEGHKDRILSVAFSPDGKTLASAGADETVMLWDVASRTKLGEPLEGHKKRILSVAFSPDGKTLASAGADETVILWDVASRTKLGEPLEGHKDRILSVAFSHDGKTLASAGADETVILWDLASRTKLGSLEGHNVAFSPDGKTLASAGDDTVVILWDLASRTKLGSLEGHKDLIRSVAFSTDGKTLASAGDDKVVILWDVASRKPVAEPLKGHKDVIRSVAFSPDGKTLASASADQTVMLWDVDVASWMRKACIMAKRNLTHKEWRDSVGQDVEYQALCPKLPLPPD